MRNGYPRHSMPAGGLEDARFVDDQKTVGQHQHCSVRLLRELCDRSRNLVTVADLDRADGETEVAPLPFDLL